MKLLLFDIDGTLIDAAGAGLAALQAGARDAFGSEGPPLDLAGSTDEGVVRHIMGHLGIEVTSEGIAAFYDAYIPHLREKMGAPDYRGFTYSGVESLLAELSSRSDEFGLGLLTGNIAQGAWEKVQAHDLREHFHVGAWGDDHWDRNKLGPIAIERATKVFERSFHPESTIVIGDTPKDIACARACGAKVIGVGTGKFSIAELSAADVTFDTLDDTRAVIAAIEEL